jgi:hypothetical protein
MPSRRFPKPWTVEPIPNKPQPLRLKPVTIGDLIREGKLLEVHCGGWRPERHLYLDPEILRLHKRMPVPEVARHLVCSICGARNSETHNPIRIKSDALAVTAVN